MKQRRLLKKQIIKAWGRCINKDYCNQRINSEGALQVSLWAQLNSILPNNRRMFIEPNIAFKTNKGITRIIPDLVICNSREIIGVIELKYMPRAKPNYSKDIRNLARIAKSSNSPKKIKLTISNDRFRGVAVDPKIYGLSKYVLFVWAGVHAATNHKANNGSKTPQYSYGHVELQGCFMELHAEAYKNSEPDIYEKY